MPPKRWFWEDEVDMYFRMLRVRQEEVQKFMAGYDEAQSRLRLSCLCRSSVRPLTYPLFLRIVELAIVKNVDH